MKRMNSGWKTGLSSRKKDTVLSTSLGTALRSMGAPLLWN